MHRLMQSRKEVLGSITLTVTIYGRPIDGHPRVVDCAHILASVQRRYPSFITCLGDNLLPDVICETLRDD